MGAGRWRGEGVLRPLRLGGLQSHSRRSAADRRPPRRARLRPGNQAGVAPVCRLRRELEEIPDDSLPRYPEGRTT